MSKFNLGDKVIYLPIKDEGILVAEFSGEFIFESILTNKMYRVKEKDIEPFNTELTPAEKFAKLDEEAKQFRLMQAMQRCQEVNDDKKDYLKTEFVAYNEEIKVSEYHGNSYDSAAVLEEGGEQ